MKFDRALIVRQEWLQLILSGVKTWELRSRYTHIRGHIGLIESGSGLIVGETNLIDCIGPLSLAEWRNGVNKHKVPYGGNEHLAKKWNQAWVFEHSRRLQKPIPYEHPRGAVIWVKIA